MVAFTSCNSADSVENNSISKEFNFKDENYKAFPELGSMGNSVVENNTVQNGGIYRLKLFIENHKALYNSDSVKPIFKFHEGGSISSSRLYDSDKVVAGIQDTAFIKFVANDENLKKGEVTKKKWHGLIIIPRPGEKDAVFAVEREYLIQQK